MKPLCVVSCPIDTHSGYGARSRDFVKALIEAKGNEWDIKILSQMWGGTPWGYLKNDPQFAGFRSLIIPNLTKQPDIWIQITIPNEFQPVGKFNIGVTAGIETTVCDAPWIEGLNRMDLNLVSSNHSKQVFKDIVFTKVNKQTNQPEGEIKLEKPVEVLLEGLNLDVFYKTQEKTKILNDIQESFCFLFTGGWLHGDVGHDRKNIYNLIETFYKTFKGRGSKPALLLKTQVGSAGILDKEEIYRRIHLIRDKFDYKEDLPNIYVLHGDFTNEELNLINNHPRVKAFISLTKGEGFGRPLLEQAITGKPVIAPNWSGHVDFIKPEYNVLLGGELEDVHKSVVNQWLLKEGKWFSADLKIASMAMKDMYKNYKKYIVNSRKQTQFLKENFSYDVMKNNLSSYLDKINITVNVPLQLPKLKIKGKNDTPSLPKLSLPKLQKV